MVDGVTRLCMAWAAAFDMCMLMMWCREEAERGQWLIRASEAETAGC